EEDGLASSPMGCLETRIMPELGSSGCSGCSTTSSACSGFLIASPVGSFCSFGLGAASCTGVGDWDTDSVVAAVGEGEAGLPPAVAGAGRGGGGNLNGAVCSPFHSGK